MSARKTLRSLNCPQRSLLLDRVDRDRLPDFSGGDFLREPRGSSCQSLMASPCIERSTGLILRIFASPATSGAVADPPSGSDLACFSFGRFTVSSRDEIDRHIFSTGQSQAQTISLRSCSAKRAPRYFLAVFRCDAENGRRSPSRRSQQGLN